LNIHKGGHVDVEHAERMLKAAGHKVPETKPTLEVNPHYPLVSALKHELDEKRFADWSHILLDQAVLAEGGSTRRARCVRETAERIDAGAGGDGALYDG
jgi:HSP90 family molecular chaperone